MKQFFECHCTECVCLELLSNSPVICPLCSNGQHVNDRKTRKPKKSDISFHGEVDW